ncbi:MAG: hypothetical protein WBP69_08860 [Terriglobales bacterium]
MDNRIRDERSHFVLNGRNRFGAEPGGIALVFFEPETPDVGILNPARDVPTEARIGEQPEDVAERCGRLIEERQQGIP